MIPIARQRSFGLPQVPYPDLVPVLNELRRVLKPNRAPDWSLPDRDRRIQAYLRSEALLLPNPEQGGH